MRVNTNMASINAYRMQSVNNQSTQKSLQKLSSGQRINGARDDAAGLAISEKMRTQIRGLNQASRNIQDGVSMLQTTEGGLAEVHSLTQRGRELAVQAASDTLTHADRQALQSEVDNVITEIDRIANQTQFNTINVLNVSGPNADKQQIMLGLKTSWLEQSEKLVKDLYGLQGDGAQIAINLNAGTPGGALASVSWTGADGMGRITGMSLNIDVVDFVPGTLPNGTNPFSAASGMYNDRILAHEMVHAIMGRTMDFNTLATNDTWFAEGAAEFIHGADSRLQGDLSWAEVLGANGVADIVSEITTWGAGDSGDANWNASWDYSAGYAAVRYLHSQIIANGGNGIKDIMQDLAAGQTLTAAVAGNTAYGGSAAFLADFTGANGQAFVQNLITSGSLSDTDTGAIGGANADGLSTKTAESVVADISNYTSDPLDGFQEVWPTLQGASGLVLQMGANSGDNFQFSLVNVQSSSIGLSGVDVVNQADTAISQFDTAISMVSAERSRLGAIQNRLEHAMQVALNSEENTTASESRIRDVSMAKEMISFSKNNILAQAATAMLAQANQQPQGVLQLLRVS